MEYGVLIDKSLMEDLQAVLKFTRIAEKVKGLESIEAKIEQAIEQAPDKAVIIEDGKFRLVSKE